MMPENKKARGPGNTGGNVNLLIWLAYEVKGKQHLHITFTLNSISTTQKRDNASLLWMKR